MPPLKPRAPHCTRTAHFHTLYVLATTWVSSSFLQAYIGLRLMILRARPITLKSRPAVFRLFGWGNVCTEIARGIEKSKLSQFKSDPVVVKYRKAVASNSSSSISTDDLLRLSRACLEATESAEGRDFDPNAEARVKLFVRARSFSQTISRTRPATIRPEISGDSSGAKLTASRPHSNSTTRLYSCQKFRAYRQVCTDLNSVYYNSAQSMDRCSASR
jgi:hypothetical protein